MKGTTMKPVWWTLGDKAPDEAEEVSNVGTPVAMKAWGSGAENREMTGKSPNQSLDGMHPFPSHLTLSLFPCCLYSVRIPTGVSRIELHPELFPFRKENETFIEHLLLH